MAQLKYVQSRLSDDHTRIWAGLAPRGSMPTHIAGYVLDNRTLEFVPEQLQYIADHLEEYAGYLLPVVLPTRINGSSEDILELARIFDTLPWEVIELVRVADPGDSHLIFRLDLRMLRGEHVASSGNNREIVKTLSAIHQHYHG